VYSKVIVWRTITVDESKAIPVNQSEPLDLSLFDEYDMCITGAAMKQFENRPSWKYMGLRAGIAI
jgi:cation-transporting ATPase 13A1